MAQSASANTYGTKTNIGGTSLGALYITGVYVEVIAGTNLPTYVGVQLYVTASTVIDTMNVPLGPTSGVASTQWAVYKPIYPPVPVAASTQILAATASSVASAISYLVTLECILATNYVDDGVAVGTVTTVTNQLTAAQVATGIWQDTTSGDFTVSSSIGKSLYTTGNAPGAASGIALVGSNMGTITGALTAAQIATGIWQDTTAGDFTTALSVGKSVMNGVSLGTGLTVASVSGAVGSVTGAVGSVTGAVGSVTGNVGGNVTGSVGSVTANVTFGNTSIATVTNLTNAPTAGDFTAAMKTSLNAATPASVVGAVGSVTGLTASNLDVAVSSRLATAGYTAPLDAAGTRSAVGLASANLDTQIAALPTTSTVMNADIKKVNGTTVTGNGSALTPWGP